MEQFYRDVINTINQTAMFNNCTGCVLAVSGGSDSMAMLDFFYSNRGLFTFKFIVAHVNHGLRAESDEELRLVQDYCKQRGVGCETIKLELLRTKPEGISIETYARKKRYEFFDTIRATYKYSHIATAHNENDNIETLLMHIMRGSGTDGACAIPVTRSDGIVRPLINICKDTINEHCRKHAIPFAVDATNLENVYIRNIYRNEIIPKLKQLNPSCSSAMAEFIQLMQTDTEYLTACTDTVYYQTVSETNATINIPQAKVLHPAILSRCIRRLYTKLCNAELGFACTKAVCNLIYKGTTADEVYLPGKLKAKREYQTIIFKDKNPRINEIAPIKPVIGRNKFDIFTLEVEEIENDADLDLSLLDKITIRSYETGDKICIHAGAGTKTLKKLFCDAKIPVDERKRIPIAELDGEIVFVYGFGTAEELKPKGKGIKFTLKN